MGHIRRGIHTFERDIHTFRRVVPQRGVSVKKLGNGGARRTVGTMSAVVGGFVRAVVGARRTVGTLSPKHRGV